MKSIYILTGIIVLLVCIVICLAAKLAEAKKQADQILFVLEDMEQGNLNHRAVARGGVISDEVYFKLNRVAQAYGAQLERAARTEQTNQRLMTSLSHDIRTPLTTLMGYLDAIQEHIVEGEERERYIQTAQSKAYALKNYTDDLFEWFRLHSKEKTFHFEKVDIAELSRSILAEWIPTLEKSGFTYDILIPEEEMMMQLDGTAYRRILNNLLQNAMQHSDGSWISVAVKSQKDTIQIEVSDNGKGIGNEDLPHVFDRLYKSDTARTSSNSGLGLSIVYELVTAMGGTIAIESAPNEKTTFFINMKTAR